MRNYPITNRHATLYSPLGDLNVETALDSNGKATRKVSETPGKHKHGTFVSIVTDFDPRHRLQLMRSDYISTDHGTERHRETYAQLARGDFALSATWKDSGKVEQVTIGNTVGARETVNFLLGPFLLKALPTLVEQLEDGQQQLSIDVRGDIFEFTIPAPGKDGHLGKTDLKQADLRALALKLREANIERYWSFPQRLYRPNEAS